MKEKKAFVNAVFGTMEAVDGAKKVGKAYNDTNNKYDNAMGTNLVKAPKVMGNQNAMVSGKPIMPKKTASEELDYIHKEAGIMGKHDVKIIQNAIKGAPGALKGAVDSFDAATTKHMKDAVSAAKNKQYMSALQHGASAVPGALLGTGMIAGAGMGTSKLLKKLDGRDNPQNNIEYNTIGGAISAGMALKALSSGRMLAPASTALGILANQAVKVPVNVAKNTPAGKAINIAGQGMKNTVTQAGKVNKDISFIGSRVEDLMKKNSLTFDAAKDLITKEQIANLQKQNWQLGKTDPAKLQKLVDARMGELSHAFETVGGLVNKKASDRLDDIYKVAGAKADYLQGVVKNKFFKSGLESLPYYAGTAMIGLAVDKKVQQKAKDAELYKAHQERLKNKENQLDKQEKMASAEAVFFKNPTANKVFKQSLESAVEGVGRMAIPLAASTIIGRDITNSLKKIDRSPANNGTTPDEASIQLSRKDRKQMKKELGDNQSKVAEELPRNSGDVVEEIVRGVEKDIIGASDKLDGDKVHIGPGIKKQFRMNPSHGLHGMTE